MKLQCQIEVVNRLHSNLNIRCNSKYVKSTLALGKEPKNKNDNEYFVLHFSSVNKTGVKYKIKCIKQVFVKCLNDGKATIRFEEPPHDLCIKCEAIQLKGFMRLLKQCILGEKKDLPNLCSIGVTAKEIAPTKLVIHSRDEFPVKGLPRTLEALYLSGLKLCNFRRDILLLRQLTILDLSDNEIEKLPPEFGRMPNLSELYLSNNQIGNKETVDWKWLTTNQITKSLKLLDLSGNKLKNLPNGLWKLQKLITLKLDNNNLEKLPVTIGRLSSLRYLSISQNKLKSLPSSILQCRLESLDISVNQLFVREDADEINLKSHWNLIAGSLVHIAAKVVLKHKIYYAPNLIPWTLVLFLDNANICVCGAPVVNDIIYKKTVFELKNFYKTVVFDNSSSVIIDCVFCSFKCYNRFSVKLFR